MNSCASSESDRAELERRAAAMVELRRRRGGIKTVYGIYEPTGEFGGRLVRCLQEQEGKYVEVDTTPTVTLPIKLEPFLTIPKRFKILFGGRGSAKSQSIAAILAAQAKDYGDKTLCLREMQNTIEDSVHALLAAQIREHDFGGFEVTDKAIRKDGEDIFKFRGLARNVDGVKSMFGFKKGWVEEAQGLTSRSIEALTPTIRESGSEIWFSLNPQSSADPMSARFLQPFYNQLITAGYYEDDLHLIAWINYQDNPWHGELESERSFDREHKSDAFYRHKWLGHYNDEVENSVIPAEYFDAAVDAHIKLGFKGEGAKIAAYDPSDLGPDDKGYTLRHGSVVLDVAYKATGDVNEGTDWALNRAIASGADHFVWDCDGMGVGLKRQVHNALDGKKMEYIMFRGSESPENPRSVYIDTGESSPERHKTHQDTFANRRAQYYIRLRDRFYATYRAVVKGEYINPDDMISISSGIECLEALRAEVCRIPLKPNANGKIQIMSKVEMQKKPYQLPSPNLADSLMMSMVKPTIKRQPIRIQFEGW